MIKIYIAKISDCCENCFSDASLLSDELKDRIENTKDKDLRFERKTAYSLLCFALLDNGQRDFSICYTEKGKPYIKNSKLAISISHTDSIAAVALSDEFKSIGIDIELISEERMLSADRFVNRYMKEVAFPKKNEFAPTNTVKYIGKDNFIVQKSAHGILSSLEKWCIAEAVLKCDGGGFSSMPVITDLFKEIAVESKILSLGDKKYILTLAEK